MRTAPILDDAAHAGGAGELIATPGLARRIGARLWHEIRESLPPTHFFFIGFNFVVLASNLLVTRYLIGLGNFMLATLGALVVGKAVLVANKIPLLRRCDHAALIRAILFKTVFGGLSCFSLAFWKGSCIIRWPSAIRLPTSSDT